MKKGILYGLLALCVALLAGVAMLLFRTAPPGGTQTVSEGRADIGGPFNLVDDQGRPVSEADLKGKVSLIYFGYSFCPDICPTDLQQIAQALDMLEGNPADAQGIFITIDPERDTPEHMAEHVKLFHPDLRGFTGTPAQIEVAAKAYRAYYKKVSAEQAGSSDYLMDHSAFIYLMDRDGQFVRVFGHGVDPAELVAAIRALK